MEVRNNNDIDLSVVIPMYNGERCIARCIKSVVDSCEDLNYEIIVVNDGSTDNGSDIVQSIASTNSCVKIINQANGGLSRARNAGLSKVSGRYLCMIDCDDTMLPHAYHDCVKVLDSEGADILHFGFRIYRENKVGELRNDELLHKYCPPTDYRVLTANEFIKAITSQGDFGAWSFIFRTSYYKEHNLKFRPDFKTCEEIIFTFDLLRHVPTILDVPQQYYCYIWGDESITRTKSLEKKKMYNDEYPKALVALHKFQSHPYFSQDPQAVNVIKVLKDTRQLKYIFDLIRLNYTTDEIKQALTWLQKHKVYPLGEFPNLPEYNYGGSLKFKILWRLVRNKWFVIAASRLYKTISRK